MALKDLVSDLSNFRTKGETGYDKLDGQIENGVDFFPNDEATGFTPKTNLESLYYKANSAYTATEFKPVSDGIKAAPNAGVRTNTKTRAAYGEAGEYEEVGNPGLSKFPSISISDHTNFATPWSSDFPPQFSNPFLESPILTKIGHTVSLFNDNPFSLTFGTKAEPIRGDRRYNDRTYYMTNQPAGNNYDWPHHENAHSITDSLSKLLHDTHHLNRTPSISSPNWIFGNILGVHTQPKLISDFLTIPLENYASQYPTTPSVTWGDQDGTMAGPVGSHVQPKFLSDFLTIPLEDLIVNGELYTSQYPTTPSVTWGDQDGTITGIAATWPAIVPETSLFRIGAITNFPTVGIGSDVSFAGADPMDESPFGGGIPANIIQSVTEGSGGVSSYSTLFVIPEIVSDAVVGQRGRDNADYQTENNLGPFNYIGDFITDTLEDRAGVGAGVGGFRDVISNDKKRYGGGKGFPEVLAGLDSNNKESYKSFREVADPEHFQLFRQPFILREIGNQWGLDNVETDGIGGFFGSAANLADTILGGFVRGAPGFTGLVSRSITDKIRIGKFLLTGAGLTFLGKQYALQAINPTLESKVYNPLSVLGLVGAGDAWDAVKTAVNDIAGTPNQTINIGEFGQAIAQFALSATLPIGHPERHLGGGRYEDVNPLKKLNKDEGLGKYLNDVNPVVLKAVNDTIASIGPFSRLQAIAQNFEFELPEIPGITKGGTFKLEGGDFSNNQTGASRMIMINPNKYLFPVSSAPVNIYRGVPSFFSGPDVAKSHAHRISKVKGSTFNKQTHVGGLITKHSALSYERLEKNWSYTAASDQMLSPGELNEWEDPARGGSLETKTEVDDRIDELSKVRHSANKIVNNIGNPGQVNKFIWNEGEQQKFKAGKFGELGIVKGTATTPNVDKINILPVLHGETLPAKVGDEEHTDFIKFRFKDVVNNKYLVFRAILSGITDTITPEFNPVKYIGRPDNLYTYKGVDIEIAFNFKIYPKTKQELSVLMEKLNYLVGLCYPSYTDKERMVTPFIELTIGDMFVDAPGLLSTLAITVEDVTTWEIDEGLQFPHYISAACSFKYIGKHIPVSTGKHYDLDWLSGDIREGRKPLGSYNKTIAGAPNRTKHDWMDVVAGLKSAE